MIYRISLVERNNFFSQHLFIYCKLHFKSPTAGSTYAYYTSLENEPQEELYVNVISVLYAAF